MQTQLVLDLDDLVNILAESELIKKNFPKGDWVVQWHFVDDEFQFGIMVKEEPPKKRKKK